MVNQLLTKALHKAKKLSLNKHSKYILFSDLHKGNNSYADDFLKNMHIYRDALHHYYINDYTYIELGDGIELWENKSIQPIIDAHQVIFDLLGDFQKQKRLFLIYGNHDMIFRFPWFVRKLLNSVINDVKYYESILLQTKQEQESILLIHGHQADYMNYMFWWLNRFLVRYVWKPLQLLGINDPTSPAKNNKKLVLKVEERIQKWIKSHQNQFVIFGHTHRPLFPSIPEQANRETQISQLSSMPLFNTGSCVHPDAITGIEIENLKIALVKWHYNKKGSKIIKEYIGGPMELSRFWSL